MIKEEKKNYKFSLETLQTIIGKNLILFEYYDRLYPLLRINYPSSNPNNKNNKYTPSIPVQKPTLCLMPVKQYFNNLRNDSLSHQQLPFPIANAIIYQILPKQRQQQCYRYQQIQQCLQSQKFIVNLPLYINSVLTKTNIGIVKQALKIHMLLQTNIQRSKALQRIKNIINTLTLYQIQKNTTQIICNLQQLNTILQKLGLICTNQQYQFYYQYVWSYIQQEEITKIQANKNNIKKQFIKRLQIFDILPLAVQLQQIYVYKYNLKQWIGSQQFLKMYNNRKNKYITRLQKTCKNIKQQPYIEENFNLLKLKIQSMGSMDLLKQIEKRKYDLEKHVKKFGEFRKGLLEEIQKQNDNKKIFNIISSKSTKSLFLSQSSALHKTKPLITMNQNLSSTLQKYKTRYNRHKQQQQAFNTKILNGFYIKEQIVQEITDGTKEFYGSDSWKDRGQWVEQVIKQNNSLITQKKNIIIPRKQHQHKTKTILQNKSSKQRINKSTKQQLYKSTIKQMSKCIKQNTNKQIVKQSNKKSRLMKLTSIDVFDTFSQLQNNQQPTIKKQNKIGSVNYFDVIKQKIMNQPFHNIGKKVFNQFL